MPVRLALLGPYRPEGTRMSHEPRMAPDVEDDDEDDDELIGEPIVPAIQVRPCMNRCGRTVKSQGPYHRLCPRCNDKNQGVSRRDAAGPSRASVQPAYEPGES